ncbi:MAG: hypothetical protein ACYTAF_08015 [Planctomycetota bacterium]|jgi:hypothetical protein
MTYREGDRVVGAVPGSDFTGVEYTVRAVEIDDDGTVWLTLIDEAGQIEELSEFGVRHAEEAAT